MRFLFVVFAIAVSAGAVAQSGSRKLPRNVNRPNTDNFYPVISPDGKYIYYFTDYTNFGDIEVRYTEKVGNQWSNPKEADPDLYKANLSHKGSIFITYLNDAVYFGTRKSPTIGGFDIYMGDNNSGSVTDTRNIGKPVNSSSNEGAPSLSLNGEEIYFMRCKLMDVDSEDDCKIFRATRKSSGLWNEPEELPASLNQGDTRFPVIMPDGETLIFSSDKSGNFDLYMARKQGSGWTNPMPLDFLNSEQNEKRVTAPLPGDILFYSSRDVGEKRQLSMIRLEDPYMPKHLYMIKGHAFDSHNHPLEALVQAIDIQTGEVLAYDTSDPTSGSFEIILTEGADCDFSIFPKDLKHAYYSTLLPLSAMERSERKFLDVELGELREKPNMMLGELVISAGGEKLPDDLNISLNRLAYLLKENPEVKVEVGGFMSGYRQDSIMLDPELTEVRYDTVQVTQVVEIVDSVMTSQSLLRIDSLISIANDSLENRNIDSLKRSVLSYKPVIRYDTIIQEEVVATYHNDRTLSYARQYVEALIEKGIDQRRLQAAGYREELWEEIVFDPEQDGTQYRLALRYF